MRLRILIVLTLTAMLVSCSDSGTSGAPPTKVDSAFKAQTDALEKAKEVEQITLDAAKQQQHAVEEQTD